MLLVLLLEEVVGVGREVVLVACEVDVDDVVFVGLADHAVEVAHGWGFGEVAG